MIVGRGTLLAHLFENPRTGVTRGVYWGMHLREFRGGNLRTRKIEAINFDLLTFPSRRFYELTSISPTTYLDPDYDNCSVYHDAEHIPAELDKLVFGPSTSAGSLTVLAALRVIEGSPVSGPVEIEATVLFEGLIVIPDNFVPPPGSPEEVSALAAPYLSLDELERPAWDRFRYVLKPRLR